MGSMTISCLKPSCRSNGVAATTFRAWVAIAAADESDESPTTSVSQQKSSSCSTTSSSVCSGISTSSMGLPSLKVRQPWKVEFASRLELECTTTRTRCGAPAEVEARPLLPLRAAPAAASTARFHHAGGRPAKRFITESRSATKEVTSLVKRVPGLPIPRMCTQTWRQPDSYAFLYFALLEFGATIHVVTSRRHCDRRRTLAARAA
mmetsp:Transcript_3637/g.9410  ORF Transcript_3637/g.9410 Transcript_3637/m.9410 type:complete len:206 (-) Transcript_3637:259-876(-)